MFSSTHSFSTTHTILYFIDFVVCVLQTRGDRATSAIHVLWYQRRISVTFARRIFRGVVCVPFFCLHQIKKSSRSLSASHIESPSKRAHSQNVLDSEQSDEDDLFYIP